MGILSNSLIDTNWGNDLVMALHLFKQDPNMTNLGHIRSIVQQNCEERVLKLIWNKHKYIGIDRDTPSLVIAGCDKPDSYCANVYVRLHGNTWTYDMKWWSLARTEIPLTQGPRYSSYQKFILPDEIFRMIRENI